MANAEYEKKYGKGPHVAVDAVIFYTVGQDLDWFSTEWMSFVALIQRKDGSWALPGGFVKPEQTLFQAVRAEVSEETGLSLTADECSHDPFPVDDVDRDPRSRVITNVYIFDLSSQEEMPVLVAGDDAINAKWIEVNELKSHEKLYADHNHLIELALERYDPS